MTQHLQVALLTLAPATAVSSGYAEHPTKAEGAEDSAAAGRAASPESALPSDAEDASPCNQEHAESETMQTGRSET